MTHPFENQFNMNDADTLGFVQSQMSHIEATVYRRKYPTIQYMGLIPVDTSANPWAKTVTFMSMDGTAKAKFLSANGTDMPFVGLSRNQFQSSIHMAGIGYQYNIEEVAQAQMLGINLSSEDAQLARRGYEEFVDECLLEGNGAKNFEGLINHPSIAIIVAPNGAAGTATWATKTADEVLADINNALSSVYVDSQSVEVADTLLMGELSFVQIANKRINGTSTTLLEYIRKNNILTARYGMELKIRVVRGLDTAGAGGTRRLLAYRNDMEVLKAHIPMPFRFLPMQTVDLMFKVPGIFRFGGLDVRLPGACRYLDGI